MAVSPQTIEKSQRVVNQNHLTFDVLRDAGNEVAARYGIRFALPDDLRAIYLKFAIDLPAYDGEDSWTLPMPTRLVIDRTGIVRVIDADPDYRNRPEAQKTIDDLRALST